uniref:hypothetical protein n=1 Tax=Gelidibacter sp. TaxID=2018083 RepID=UPI004049FE85
MRILFFLFFSSYCFAQSAYQGLVFDEFNEAISGVVITVAKSETPNDTETITVSNDDGTFELILEAKIDYIIKTRHLSYADASIEFNSTTSNTIKITLLPSNNTLDEIIIKHEKPKVTSKRDTVSFDIAKYIDANDRKLKDLVEKLPGITLQEDGTIYFKGERITKLLVENEEFFGGGTKLGLDNIPADAIEKLEIIANYSKSNLLKNSRRTEAQVINLILKENRKHIVFGSVDGATNFDEFYKLHASVFQFQPKQQNNFIGDINNIAEQSLSNNESYSFANVNSELFKLTEIPIDYNVSDREFSGISNKLLTANIKRIAENSTWDFIGYYTQSQDEIRLSETQEYFNNNSFENTNQSESNTINNLYLRATNYYQTAKKERIIASVINFNTRDKTGQILSDSNFGTRNFNSNNTNDGLTLGLILEEIRPLKNKNNIVYGFKAAVDNKDNTFLLNSNQQFLEDIIPWVEQNTFTLINPNYLKTKSFETGATYYKNINSYQSLSVSSKWNFEYSDSNNNQRQQLDNSFENQLPNQFISKSSYSNFQFINRLSYRFNKNRWDLNMSVELNSFHLNFKNTINKSSTSKLAFNPFVNTLFRINNKKQLTFNYNKNIQVPSINQLDNFFKVQSYTSIIVGNQQLGNAINHNFSINYSDYNIPKNYSLSFNQSLTINDKAFATSYDFNDINSLATYLIQENAGLNYQSRNSFIYLFNKWEIGLRVNYTSRKENILLTSTVESFNQRLNISPRVKTDFKTMPNISFSPFWSKNNQRFDTNERNFISNGFQTKLDYNFSNNFYSFIGYNYSDVDGSKAFDSLDFEIRFTNKIKSMDISIIGINALSNKLNKKLIFNSLFQMASINEALGGRILLKCSYNF